jgi:type VII secretion integral membrane protein EccD
VSGPGAAAAAEPCRLTVVGPARRADLAVPASVTLGELLPWLLRHVADEDDRWRPWVLHRLGEEPLDPEHTPESAQLRHGDVLHLRAEGDALPAAQFDDVAVGVAGALSDRRDIWRPAFTGRLQLGTACLALTAFVAAATGAHPWWRLPVYLGFGAVVLGAGCALAGLRRADTAIGVVGGLGACVLAALTGLAARRGLPGIESPGREGVLLAGACAAVVAFALLAVFAGLAGSRPASHTADRAIRPVFGAALVTGLAAVAGSWLALAAHWDATRASAVLAVVMFVTGGRSLRLVLRAAGLRVPYLPRDAEELQQDIEPEPGDRVARRAATAVAWLDSLTMGSSVVFGVAFVQLLRSPRAVGWIGLALAATLAAAVLLRARGMAGVRQRAFLAISGAFGFAALAVAMGVAGSPLPRAAAPLVLLAAGGALLAAAGRPPGSRLLPIWGHLADLLETGTAVALVPLLLQLLHVYAYARNLAG